ncbi:MAG: peptidylprolyl isomerase, partial [Bacteroidetes bacterium]|nr:peptidylprolyl isomerase [Bacteroidota bacterium]
MKKLTPFITNIVFAIQVLLIFMLIFEHKVSLPVWVSPFGRMHPLVLHFPIALLVLVGLMQVFRKEFESESFYKIQSFILLISAFSASVAALMGFFLAQEDGYSGELLLWHKWTGVGVSLLSYILLLYQNNKRQIIFNTGLVLCLILLIFAGHFGASLTHGEDFVWAPLKKESGAFTDESTVFEAAIMPILEKKCTSCHNERKHKGELIMTSIDDLLKGGENGPLWVKGDAENSLLIERIHLPMDAEEHMPPEGKPQLSQAEITLLSLWIDAGADIKKIIGELSPEDSIYHLIKQGNLIESKVQKPAYSFQSASPETIEKLNNPFRTVAPESYGSS